MSLTDFDDLYRICCDWGKGEFYDAAAKSEVTELSDKAETYGRLTHSICWWEAAAKEIHKVRENVLL